MSTSPDGSAIDLERARAFGEKMMNGIVSDNRSMTYAAMEREFQGVTSRAQFDQVLDKLYEQFGKPVSYEYGYDGVFAKMLYNGQSKPVRKLYYNVSTTRYPKGTYYLAIEVVPDGSRLASTGVYFGDVQK